MVFFFEKNENELKKKRLIDTIGAEKDEKTGGKHLSFPMRADSRDHRKHLHMERCTWLFQM